MFDRYWGYMAARLVVGVAVVAWAVSYLQPSSGEKEFQKTLEAMKQVRSFRVACSVTPEENLHEDTLWEVDCDHDITHRQLHSVESSMSPPRETARDELYMAGNEFNRRGDGSWRQARSGQRGSSAKSICTQLAQGTDSNILPPISTMIRRGVIQKGDMKSVSGVQCREWRVTLRAATTILEHDTVCLGEDHLPYEMTRDSYHVRASFSDYNTPIQFDLPEAVVSPANAQETN